MFNLFILTVGLKCGLLHVIDNSHQPWTKEDDLKVEKAKYSCETYYPQTPCLRRYIKYPESVRIVCKRQEES